MRRFFVPVGLGLMVGWMTVLASTEPRNELTVARLAEILIPALNLENQLPKTLVRLTPEETCRVECGVLVNNGLSMFAGADCNRCVTRLFLAEVVYELTWRELALKAATPGEKLSLLAGRQIIPPGEPEGCLTEADAMAALSHPEVNASIAAYLARRPISGTGTKDPISDPFTSYRLRNVTEGPLSPISPSGKK